MWVCRHWRRSRPVWSEAQNCSMSLRQARRTPLLGERFAAARRTFERRWGCHQVEVPLSRLWHAVPSYPTISEVWLRLLETYGL